MSLFGDLAVKISTVFFLSANLLETPKNLGALSEKTESTRKKYTHAT